MNAVEPTSKLHIRDASRTDLDAIIHIDKEIVGSTKPDYWHDAFDTFSIQRDQGYFLVAEYQGQIMGFIIGEIRAFEFGSPPCGWVFALGVSKTNRLQGIGTQMLNAICGRFRQAGISKVRTMVDRRNQEVMSFFRSQGMMAGPYQELEKDLS